MNETLQVNFYGDNLYLIFVDEQLYVPMRSIVIGMGLDWMSQAVKLRNNPTQWNLTTLPVSLVVGMREALCIPLSLLSDFLQTINLNKVKPQLREKIELYQRECAVTLKNYWHGYCAGQKSLPDKVTETINQESGEADTQLDVISLKFFDNSEFGQLRAVIENGEPWFVARDVAEALGYTNPAEAIRDNCNYAKLLKNRSQLVFNNINNLQDQSNNFNKLEIPIRGLLIIPEADVYALIFRSNLPTAAKFRDWVFREVLPSIRKTGTYTLPKDRFVRRLALENDALKKQITTLTQQNETLALETVEMQKQIKEVECERNTLQCERDELLDYRKTTAPRSPNINLLPLVNMSDPANYAKYTTADEAISCYENFQYIPLAEMTKMLDCISKLMNYDVCAADLTTLSGKVERVKVFLRDSMTLLEEFIIAGKDPRNMPPTAAKKFMANIGMIRLIKGGVELQKEFGSVEE